jgi:hypothetical protein
MSEQPQPLAGLDATAGNIVTHESLNLSLDIMTSPTRD